MPGAGGGGDDRGRVRRRLVVVLEQRLVLGELVGLGAVVLVGELFRRVGHPAGAERR
jgi:hypothetical protein